MKRGSEIPIKLVTEILSYRNFELQKIPHVTKYVYIRFNFKLSELFVVSKLL